MPETLNRLIRFGTTLHKQILSEVMDRKRYSREKMEENHHDRWEQADENMQGYIPLSEADKLRKSRKRFGSSDLDYVTLEVPYHFAIISSMHTYISSVFLARAPVYQFTARHGEGQDAVQAVEAVMDYQLRVGRHLPYHYHWLYDACKYGLGIVGEFWDEETKRVSTIIDEPSTVFGIPTGNTRKIRVVEEVPGYQGNRLYNIRPFDWFPDPRLPVYDFQRGEFCGRQVKVAMSDVLNWTEQLKYFNVDVLRKTDGKKQELDRIEAESIFSPSDGVETEPGSPQVDQPFGRGEGTDSSAPGKNFVHLLEMCIRIQPRRWKMGDSDNVEKWIFTVANERVVIGARPLGFFHDKFPYSINETGFGSEDFIKHNTMDHTRPLVDALTWLFNTHMYSVRKHLNGHTIVDPSKIVMKDFEQPQPGGRVRLKPQFYGGDVRTAAFQLQMGDPTTNHLRDSQVIEQLIQRTSGVVDNIMGLVNPQGRKTATEVRTASGFSINRMKTFAEYFSAVGQEELMGRLLSNTQQLMTLERKFAIAGNTIENAEKFVDVDPNALAGFFDFVPVDGTLPVDRLAQANFWKELLVQLARIPELAAQWDFGEMIAHTMTLQGERNVNRFKIQVGQPGATAAGAQAGNLVPLRSVAGNGQGRAAGTSGGTV